MTTPTTNDSENRNAVTQEQIEAALATVSSGGVSMRDADAATKLLRTAIASLQAEVAELKEQLDRPYCMLCGSCGIEGCCKTEMCKNLDETTRAELVSRDDSIKFLEQENTRLKAEVARCHERLEIDHYWQAPMNGAEPVRVEIPMDKRSGEIDGISCRDETIKLQDARINSLKAEVERKDDALREINRNLETSFNERKTGYEISADLHLEQCVGLIKTALAPLPEGGV